MAIVSEVEHDHRNRKADPASFPGAGRSYVYEYLHKPAVNCFVCMKLETLEDAKAEIKNRIGETEYYFAITLKENGKVIGEINAYPETGETHADENTPRDTFSPCWMLNVQYQGKGYAHEAAHAFFDYLFKEKGARRIYAYTEDCNLSSQHLCEMLGMRREGMFNGVRVIHQQPGWNTAL